jgi:hypothetical protein
MATLTRTASPSRRRLGGILGEKLRIVADRAAYLAGRFWVPAAAGRRSEPDTTRVSTGRPQPR